MESFSRLMSQCTEYYLVILSQYAANVDHQSTIPNFIVYIVKRLKTKQPTTSRLQGNKPI